MSNYTIERLSEENLEYFIRLFKEISGYTPSREDVIRKFSFLENTDLQYMGFLAFDDSRKPAACYEVFPVVYNIKGRLVLCAKSGSTMTGAAHRGKGLFISLARQTYKLAADFKLEYVFSTPNSQSHHGFATKLNWTMPYRA